ncbi:MAG: hypothetical protein AUJ88_01305 [Gallionellaceae bacterium CG1_02_56_997]|nr:MAG: hypothetical protein AUJ88_01305 [Gallionellaceae bacterium CG1_02_56_997]
MGGVVVALVVQPVNEPTAPGSTKPSDAAAKVDALFWIALDVTIIGLLDEIANCGLMVGWFAM